MSKPDTGGLLVAAASILWGLSGTAAKYLFTHEAVTPWVLTEIRLTVSAVFLGLVLAVVDRESLQVKRADLIPFAVLGVIGMAMVQFTSYLAISLVGVATKAFLQNFSPALVVTYETAAMGRRLTARKVVSLLLVLSGMIIIILGGGTLAVSGLGVAAGILSAVFDAFYSVYSKCRLSEGYRPWTVLLYSLIFGAVFWWVVLPPGRVFHPGYSLMQWFFFLYIALFATLIPWGLYLKGLALTSAGQARIINTLEPVAAAFTAAFLLGEMFTILQAAGGALILAGVGMAQQGEAEKAAAGTRKTAHADKYEQRG